MSSLSGPGQKALAAALHSYDDANLIALSVAGSALVPALVVSALTDSSGGAAADGTIGAITAPTALTDNGAGTADGTVAAMTAVSTAGGNTYADTVINTPLSAIRDNFKEITTTQVANRLAIIALQDAVKELATKVNAILTSLKNANVMASS